MQELIKVTRNEKGESVVSARELHTYLEIGRDFTNWCKGMFTYGFEEGIDYARISESVNQYVKRFDYVLTLNTAKEIAMIQRTEKGKQARQYFIECERIAIEATKPIEDTIDLLEHTKVEIQVNNSKKINQKNWVEGGEKKAIEYNISSCLIHTKKTPKQMRAYGKQMGLSSTQCSSAKTVLRALKPEVACAMSLTDQLVYQQGMDIIVAANICKHDSTKLFKNLIAAGVNPKNLGA